jgi:hypothetical protein
MKNHLDVTVGMVKKELEILEHAFGNGFHGIGLKGISIRTCRATRT